MKRSLQQPSRKIKDVRHTTELSSFIPDDADEYRESLLDILERMDTGYWPTIEVKRGWYQLISELNEKLSNQCQNYKIRSLKSSSHQLQFHLNLNPSDENKLQGLIKEIMYAIARSQHICEMCGVNSSEKISEEGCKSCGQSGTQVKKRRNKNVSED